MKAFCLTKQQAQKFTKALKEKKLDLGNLSKMSSEQRRSEFSKYVGETNAKDVNALFESKLLLKNRKRGMIAWANRTIKGPPEVKRDIISRILKMDKILQPAEEKAFLTDLAAKKLGISITSTEAKKITELSKEITKRRNFSSEKERIAYGNAILDLQDYMEEKTKVPASLSKNIVNVLNLPRTLMSTWDLSAPLRQGWGMLGRKEFYVAFKEMFKYFASESAYKNIMADIITRPTYNLMMSSQLHITKLSGKLEQREEAFMSNLADKIPGVKHSERAYTGFLNKLRADVFDSIYYQAEKSGEDVTKGSKVVDDIAGMINTFTGSGNVQFLSSGKEDGRITGFIPIANNFLFSPRKIAATINMFNPVQYVKMSPVVRKEAIRNLVTSVSMTGMVLALAAMAGAEIELNPTSSDFGKVKIGNTRFDFTGGNGNYITLLARLITGQTKSTVTELSKELGDGFGSNTRLDVLQNFTRNKLSPVASFVADWFDGKNAIGDPFEAKEAMRNRLIPMTISGLFDTWKEDPELVIFSATLGALGVGVNTYSSDTNWSASKSKELLQLKEKLGQRKFEEANYDYNEEYKERFEKLQANAQYQKLSDEDKAKQITDLKSKVKDEIFRKYGFKYKRQSTKKTTINL